MRVYLLVFFLFLQFPLAQAQVAEYSGGSIYDMNPPGTQSSDGTLERIIDRNDMEPVRTLAQTDIHRVLAKSVGKLAMQIRGGKIGFCTASLISQDQILTNYHCIPSDGSVTNAVLWMGYVDATDEKDVGQYPVNLQPVESSVELDYTILQVGGKPGIEWGTVPLSASTPSANQSLFIIHHPLGFEQQLTRSYCRTHTNAIKANDLFHVCDTLGGSSGAPVFDDNSRKMVGLHNRKIGMRKLNAGKRIASIARNSPIIASLIQQIDPVCESAKQVWPFLQNATAQKPLEQFATQYAKCPQAQLAKLRLKELQKLAIVAPLHPTTPRLDVKPVIGIFPQQPTPITPTENCDGILAGNGKKTHCPKVKDVFKDCPSCPSMVVVPAGSFMMGSPLNEPGRRKNEGGILSDSGQKIKSRFIEPFAIGRYEITVKQYMKCVAAEACQKPEWRKSSASYKSNKFRYDDYHILGKSLRFNSSPIVGISWDDAQSYVGWLSRKIGAKYVLPREAEWEYAARAGTDSAYSFGPDKKQICQFANVADLSVKKKFKHWKKIADCNDGTNFLAKTGSKKSNSWGLYDVHGNVWEWVHDCYTPVKSNSNESTSPRNGRPKKTCKRVRRGGSWGSPVENSRSASRRSESQTIHLYHTGFRVVRLLSKSQDSQ